MRSLQIPVQTELMHTEALSTGLPTPTAPDAAAFKHPTIFGRFCNIMIVRSIRRVGTITLVFSALAFGQRQGSLSTRPEGNQFQRTIDHLFNYLNMAGTLKASAFRPLTQRERTQMYWKTMVNPLGYMKAGLSAGIDQWKDKPPEWKQGASGYGMRFANIFGQYSIQRTVTFGISSVLDEDNRYYNSGMSGIWRRSGYAVLSGVLARDSDGRRHVSVSQVGGVAAGAFLSRFWQPHSQNSASDGAISFGLSMASNMGFSVVKEFLPDIGRVVGHKRKRYSGCSLDFKGFNASSFYTIE
jgi:hypothetical protein